MNTIQERWDAKLKNWALWLSSAGLQGVSAPDREWWNQPPRPPQPLAGEALDTDQLVQKLKPEHFEAVRVYYAWSGTLEQRVADCDPPIHVNTLLDRVQAARFKLEDLDCERRRVAIRPPLVVSFA